MAALLLGALATGFFFVTSSSGANGKQVAVASPPSGDELVAAPVAAVTPFRCSASTLSATAAPAVAPINALRTGVHAGYDRVVVQFAGGQPGSIEPRPQATASFLGAPSGLATKLAGTRGLAVLVRGADMHAAYSGARDLKTAYVGLRETRVIQDFEGYVSVGLGVNGSNCYRAFVVRNPVRLVVDIPTS